MSRTGLGWAPSADVFRAGLVCRPAGSTTSNLAVDSSSPHGQPRPRVLIGIFICLLPNISHHIQHAQWTYAARVGVDICGLSHLASLVGWGSRSRIPCVSPRIESAARTLRGHRRPYSHCRRNARRLPLSHPTACLDFIALFGHCQRVVSPATRERQCNHRPGLSVRRSRDSNHVRVHDGEPFGLQEATRVPSRRCEVILRVR